MVTERDLSWKKRTQVLTSRFFPNRSVLQGFYILKPLKREDLRAWISAGVSPALCRWRSPSRAAGSSVWARWREREDPRTLRWTSETQLLPADSPLDQEPELHKHTHNVQVYFILIILHLTYIYNTLKVIKNLYISVFFYWFWSHCSKRKWCKSKDPINLGFVSITSLQRLK